MATKKVFIKLNGTFHPDNQSKTFTAALKEKQFLKKALQHRIG
jgi:hypothetical protein